MTSFKGLKCPICGVPFSDADDIVVCPECGAPYHRACYKQIGHCIYNHEAGESWSDSADSLPPEDTVRCPQCGAENPPHAQFCNNCGKSLTTPPPAGPNNGAYRTPPYQNGADPRAAYSNFFTAASGIKPEELIADDVTVDEASKAVQMNSLYYVPVFKSLHERNHGKFNFAALMFSGGWMLYRKMYKFGWLVIALQVLMNVLATCISVFCIAPITAEIYSNLGIEMTTAALSHEQQLLIAAEAANYPQLPFLSVLTYLPMVIMFVMSLVLGFCGNRIYYNHILKKVRKTRENFSGQTPGEYESALLDQGGVNPKIIIIIAVINMVMSYLPYLLL